MKKLFIVFFFILIYFQISVSQSYHRVCKEIDGVDWCGYADSSGNLKIPYKYTMAYTDTLKTIAFVANKKDGLIAIDSTGKKLFNVFIYDNGPDYLSEGLFRIENKRNGKIGFADMQGNIIILPTYFHASPFKNGIAKVTKVGKKEKVGEYTIITNGEWGLINKKGEIILPYFYDEINILDNGKIELIKGNNKIQVTFLSHFEPE